MRFREAVEATRPLREQFRVGLQALRRSDRGRVRCSDPRRLCGSVNLDEALREEYPNDPRWDYAIGVTRGKSDAILWLEAHPASSRHIDEILKKVQWLKAWTGRHAPALKALPRYYRWVATGKIAFRRGGQEEKKLAQEGIGFPSRQLNLDEL